MVNLDKFFDNLGKKIEGVDWGKAAESALDKTGNVASKAVSVVASAAQGAYNGVRNDFLEGKTFTESFDDGMDNLLKGPAERINLFLSEMYQKDSPNFKAPNFKVLKVDARKKLLQLYQTGEVIYANDNLDIVSKTVVAEKVFKGEEKSVDGLLQNLSKEMADAATKKPGKGKSLKQVMAFYGSIIEAVSDASKTVVQLKNASVDQVALAYQKSLDVYKAQVTKDEGLGNLLRSGVTKGAILYVVTGAILGGIPAVIATAVYARDKLKKQGVTPRDVLDNAAKKFFNDLKK